jgi:4-hydroxy-2-oxoglutarate aldolase
MQINNLKDPILVAPSPTPFNKNDSVNYSAIEKNVSKWLETPLTGFVLGSENGEESFLSLEEKIKIVSTVSQVNSGEKIVIGGVDNPSTIETIKESEKLVRSGADLIRIRIPRNRDSVMPYFESVLDKIPVPVLVIHQMAPGNFDSSMTQIGASPEEIGDICSNSNVFGYISSSLIRFEAKVKQHIPSEKKFWVCNSILLLPGVAIGANGACMMFGNIAPKISLDILSLAMNKQIDKAYDLHSSIIDADWNVLSSGAAGLKYALDLLGFEGGLPRSPMLELNENKKSLISNSLIKSGLI